MCKRSDIDTCTVSSMQDANEVTVEPNTRDEELARLQERYNILWGVFEKTFALASAQNAAARDEAGGMAIAILAEADKILEQAKRFWIENWVKNQS